VAAIADGAGSAAMAKEGADIAASTVVASASARIRGGLTDPIDVLKEAALEARQQVLAAASNLALPPREFASTLLAIIVSPEGGAGIQIGDGVIAINSERDSEWCWLFWPQHGEYVNTTHFLTDEDAPSLLQADKFGEEVASVALISDGLERLALHFATASLYQPFFDGLLHPLLTAVGSGEIEDISAALREFVSSDRVTSRTDDDVSIVLTTRRPILGI
jgi:hypothetical protein